MDTITVEILEDGTIKVITEGISAGNHRNADEALKMLADLMGGPVTTEPLPQRHGQQRAHGHHRAHS